MNQKIHFVHNRLNDVFALSVCKSQEFLIIVLLRMGVIAVKLKETAAPELQLFERCFIKVPSYF